MLLKDVDQITADILAGKHDDILDAIEQSVKVRRKTKTVESGLRVGAVVTFTDNPKCGELAGLSAVVTKVNKKTVGAAILLPEGESGSVAENPWETPFPVEYRVSPSLVTAAPADDSLEVRAYETRKALAYWKAQND